MTEKYKEILSVVGQVNDLGKTERKKILEALKEIEVGISEGLICSFCTAQNPFDVDSCICGKKIGVEEYIKEETLTREKADVLYRYGNIVLSDFLVPLKSETLIEKVTERYYFTEEEVEALELKEFQISYLTENNQLYRDERIGFEVRDDEGIVDVYLQCLSQNKKNYIYNLDKMNITKNHLVLVSDPLDAIVLSKALPEFNFISFTHLEYALVTFTETQFQKLKAVKDIVLLNIEDTEVKKMQDSDLYKRLGSEKIKILKIDNVFKLLKAEIEVVSEKIDQKVKGNVDDLIYLGRYVSEYKKKTANDYFATFGFRSVDNSLGGIRRGELTIIFARNNEGKSTWISQTLNNVIGQYKSWLKGGSSPSRKLKGSKVMMFSGEMTKDTVLEWQMTQLLYDPKHYTMPDHPDEFGRMNKIYHEASYLAVERYLDDCMSLIDNSTFDVSDIIDVMYKAFVRDGVMFFVIDNAMMLTDGLTGDRLQEKLMKVKELSQFGKKHDVHILLVEHTNKSKRENEKLSRFDVSGFSEVSNLADNMIYIMRYYKIDGSEDSEMEVADGYLSVEKNRKYSEMYNSKLMFNRLNKTYTELNLPDGQETMIYYDISEYYDEAEKELNGNTEDTNTMTKEKAGAVIKEIEAKTKTLPRVENRINFKGEEVEVVEGIEDLF